jgi:ATP-dependent Lon protease
MITRSNKRNFKEVELPLPNKKRRISNLDSNLNSYNLVNDSISEINTESISNTESDSFIASDSESSDIESLDTESLDSESESELLDSESESELLDSESESELLDNEDKRSYKNEFELMQNHILSIVDGSFFETNNQELLINYYKDKISLNELQLINNKFNILRTEYEKDNIDIIDILNKDYPIQKQKNILEKLFNLINSDILSSDYKYYLDELKKLLNDTKIKTENTELDELEKKILDNINNYNNSYKNQILTSKMSFNNKVSAYKYLKIMEGYDNSSSEELIKYKTWLNTLLSIPFGKYNDNSININSSAIVINNYIKEVREILDNKLSFLEKPKDQIINIITHMIRNPITSINGIGIYGPKGTGKSSLINSIGLALNRPVIRISLGGSNDANVLNGHGFTYIGSKQGKIIDALISSKSMNCIIHFDEIDKISSNDHGQEIFNTLLHLTDSTTNSKYNCDNYFSGIEFCKNQ